MLKKILFQLIASTLLFFPGQLYSTVDAKESAKTLKDKTGKSSQQDYIVGGNDVLKISVYRELELSKNRVRVSVNGNFNFALIGKVNVTGLTTGEIEEKIEKKLLKGEYLLFPQVSVLVVEYGSRKVFVLGAVKNPGSYKMQGKTSVLEMISNAGGIIDEHDRKAGAKILILRKTKEGGHKTISIDRKKLLVEGDLSLNVAVQNNDTIFVPAADVIFVFGEVKTPGSYELSEKNKTILAAITMAGGFTEMASPKKTKIVRMENGKEKNLYVNINDITKDGDKTKDLKLKSEDIIIVPKSLF